jgi:hypothetical protein
VRGGLRRVRGVELADLELAKRALLAAAVVASYPIALVIRPIRKRLAPREVTEATSPTPPRLWMLGWLLLAAAIAAYALYVRVEFASNFVVLLVFMAVFYSAILSAGQCIRTAPALEEWRNRTRKKNRLSRRLGKGAPPAEPATPR